MESIYLLGNRYGGLGIDKIIDKLVYLSYRYGFSPLLPTNLTSDMGWGCTLRSGQMLLANCLLKIQFPLLYYQTTPVPKAYYNIISLFRDDPANLLSIHKLVATYPKYQKAPGDWIGPYTLSQIIDDVSITLLKLERLQYLVFLDNNIISNQINLTPANERYLIAIPVRLGLDHLESYYFRNILYLTTCPYFMGLIGGQGNKSFYLIGSQDDKLIYLDPHIQQPFCPQQLDLSSYQTSKLHYLPIKNLAPTFTIFFLIDDNEKLQHLLNINNQLPDPKYNLFGIDIDKLMPKEVKISKTSEDWDLVDF